VADVRAFLGSRSYDRPVDLPFNGAQVMQLSLQDLKGLCRQHGVPVELVLDIACLKGSRNRASQIVLALQRCANGSLSWRDRPTSHPLSTSCDFALTRVEA